MVGEYQARTQRCAKNLSNPMYELTYHFCEFIMGPLNEFNTTFQADASMIGYLHSEMTRLLRKFLGKFVDTKVIVAASSVTEVNFMEKDNQHPDEILAVGMGTRTYLVNNPDLPPQTVTKFFRSVRDFYMEMAQKMVKKFPFQDKTLQTLGFLNPALRLTIMSDSVVDLAKRFVVDVPAESLAEEYSDFQLSPDSDLPTFTEQTRLDTYWLAMESMKTITGKQRFPHLPLVALTALSLPHSNADPERCFSVVRKIQTDQRANLSHATINSLLSVKLNTDVPCHQLDVTKELISSAKAACTSYNKKH